MRIKNELVSARRLKLHCPFWLCADWRLFAVNCHAGRRILLQAIHKEVFLVPIRAPPRPSELNQRVLESAEPIASVTLNHLWPLIPANTRQDVLLRLTLMVAQRIEQNNDQVRAQADDPAEAVHE